MDGAIKSGTGKMERGRKEEIKRTWRKRKIKWKLKTKKIGDEMKGFGEKRVRKG